MNEEGRNILWKNFSEGKNNSLAFIYKEYANELYAYGMKVFEDDSLVKDCIQEVFIQLIDRRKSLQITSSIHIYLFKSLRNKIIEELRTRKRKLQINVKIAEFDIGHATHPEQNLIEEEEQNAIRKLIKSSTEKLSDRQKEIIYLKFTENLTYDEISEILQIDKASARTLLYRTLKSLKEQLNKKISFLIFIFA